MASRQETLFKARYPNAHIRVTGRKIAGYQVVTVYAGDYLCSEGLTARAAYRTALAHEKAGLITPDPTESRTELNGR